MFYQQACVLHQPVSNEPSACTIKLIITQKVIYLLLHIMQSRALKAELTWPPDCSASIACIMSLNYSQVLYLLDICNTCHKRLSRRETAQRIQHHIFTLTWIKMSKTWVTVCIEGLIAAFECYECLLYNYVALCSAALTVA